MGRPRQISDDQILAAMRRGVLAQGPHVPLEAVAAELSVTVPALLKRFGSRQALLLAALRPPENPEWIEVVGRGPDGRPLEEQLLEMFTRIQQFLAEAVPCLAALRESGIPCREISGEPTGPERALEALRRWLTLARERGLIAATELDSAAFAMLGTLHARAFLSHMHKVELSAHEQRDFLVELTRFFSRALSTAR
jgi:AcrR family transcriptional regulator